MDSSRVAKILETAARETTPANERLNALSLAHKILAQDGKTFADIIGMGVKPMFPPDFHVPYPEWQRRVQERDAKLAEKDTELTRLRKDLASLRKRAETAEAEIGKRPRAQPQPDRAKIKTDDEGGVPFSTFVQIVVGKLGTDRWLTEFVAQSSLKTAEVEKWRSRNYVPANGVEAAKNLKARPDHTFEAFAERAQKKLGLNYGWQTNFEQQTNTSHSIVEVWKKQGFVPDSALKACEGLVVVTEKKPSVPWGSRPDLSKRVRALHQSGVTYQGIAAKMQEEFPEFGWTANVIAGELDRIASGKRGQSQSMTGSAS